MSAVVTILGGLVLTVLVMDGVVGTGTALLLFGAVAALRYWQWRRRRLSSPRPDDRGADRSDDGWSGSYGSSPSPDTGSPSTAPSSTTARGGGDLSPSLPAVGMGAWLGSLLGGDTSEPGTGSGGDSSAGDSSGGDSGGGGDGGGGGGD